MEQCKLHAELLTRYYQAYRNLDFDLHVQNLIKDKTPISLIMTEVEFLKLNNRKVHV